MPYKIFTDYPLWKEASVLTDSIFDFSRSIEDFSLRNRMTGAAVEIPFLLGEAAQSDSDETMKNLLWKVEDPVNELRSVLTEAKEHGFAPGADYELMQERCRDLFQKIHTEASSPAPIIAQPSENSEAPENDPELAQEEMEETESAPVEDSKKEVSPPPPVSPPPEKKKPAAPEDNDDFDESTLI